MAERRYTRRQKREARTAVRTPVQPQGVQLRQKATGWRIPLIFCAVIGLICLVSWGYRKLTAPPPLPLNAELVSFASHSRINLDGDEEGRRFKEELVSAGRGFSPAYVKDNKVTSVALDALDAGRIDVLVTAVQVIRDGDKRTELLHVLAEEGMKDCNNLPWAVFAVRNLAHEYATAMDLTHTINARFEQCRREMPAGWPENLPAAGNAGASDQADAAAIADTSEAAPQAAPETASEAAAPAPAAAESAPETASEAAGQAAPEAGK